MRILTTLLGLLFTCLLIAGGLFLYAGYKMEAPGPLTAARSIVIPRGSSAQTIAALLEKNDVISSRYIFRLRYHVKGKPDLKAGEYAFIPAEKLDEVMAQIAGGKTVARNFTVPEGLTSTDIVRLLLADPALTGNLTNVPQEGALLPESYRYSYGDTRASILARMEKAMNEALNDAWAKKRADLPLMSAQQLLTLASIVEKETALPAERPRVAQVFVNRLKKDMPLQTDPTVSYGITMGRTPLGRMLTYADLAAVSPYNTYVNKGLPSGPISNPGKASLLAAAQPEQNDYLYFVADGTGGHRFATTVEEHNKNVANWREIEKQKAAQQPVLKK